MAQQPPSDSSRKFLNLSGGMLMLVITGLIVLFCVAPILFCLISGAMSGDTNSK